MSVADANEDKWWLCQIQTCIPVDELDATRQMLYDRFGEPEYLYNRVTCYKQNRSHTFSIRVEESIPEPDPTTGEIHIPSESEKQKQKHRVTTLGDPKKIPISGINKPYMQHAVTSEVTGDAHQFVSSMGYNPIRTWIEKGLRFKYGVISIKVVSILRYDGMEIRPLDPDSIVIMLESMGWQATGKHLEDQYNHLFPGKDVEIPEINE